MKHDGVKLDGLMFDIDPTSKTVHQLVDVDDSSRGWSAHVAQAMKPTGMPPKGKRTVETAASSAHRRAHGRSAKKSAGGSAVSPA